MRKIGLAILVLAAGLAAAPLMAATLTDADKAMLATKKLDPAILDGLDQELAVPQAWIDGARKEGTVRARQSESERPMEKLVKVFEARYPFLKVEYVTARGRELLIAPLLAYKNGTYLSDVIEGFNGTQDQFAKAGALTDLRDLPGWKNIPDDLKRDDGGAVGWKVAYYCTAYNKDVVKPADLPKTWDDLLTNPRWGNRTVGMASRPHLWLAMLWGVYGDKWLSHYEDQIFNVWKPQLRKELTSALVKLLAVHEFDLVLPAPEFAVVFARRAGAPVAYHCPEPVPTQPGPLGILKGSPHPYAARLWVNWLLSKEGQIAANTYVGTVPAHKDLQRSEFFPFPDTMMHKKMALQTDKVLEHTPAIIADWTKRWNASGAGGSGRGKAR